MTDKIENPVEDIELALEPAEGDEMAEQAEQPAPVPKPESKSIESLEKELKELKSIIKNVATTQADVEQRTVQQQLSDIRAEQRLALEEDNARAYAAAIEKERNLMIAVQQQAARQQQAQQSAEPPPYLSEFYNENKDWWFSKEEKHVRMQEYAIMMEKAYHVKNPGVSTPDGLKYVTAQIRKEFPDEFGSEVKKSMTVQSNTSKNSSKSFDKNSVVANLTPAQRMVYEKHLAYNPKRAQEFLERDVPLLNKANKGQH